MKARDLMTADPEVLTPDARLSEAGKLMRDSDVGMIPIVNDRSEMKVEGVITDRDIVTRHVAEKHQEDHAVREHMTDGKIHSVRPDDDAQKVLDVMKRHQVRRVLVTEGDKLVGVIAQADVALQKDSPHVDETVEKISEPNR